MPGPKADTSVKGKVCNRGKTSILKSSPYFKELKDKSNYFCLSSTLDPCRTNLSRWSLFGKCGSKSKEQLISPVQTWTRRIKETRRDCFVTRYFPNQTRENSGFNVQISNSGLTQMAVHATWKEKQHVSSFWTKMWLYNWTVIFVLESLFCSTMWQLVVCVWCDFFLRYDSYPWFLRLYSVTYSVLISLKYKTE